MQGSHHPTEYYWEVGVKSGEKKKTGTKLVRDMFYFVACAQKSGTNGLINSAVSIRATQTLLFIYVMIFFFQKSFTSPEDVSLWRDTLCMLTNIQKCG